MLSEGGNLRLKVTVTGFPLPKYQWYKNNEVIVDEETYELMIPEVTQADDGSYKCEISNEESTVTSNEVQVRVMLRGLYLACTLS